MRIKCVTADIYVKRKIWDNTQCGL